MATDQQAVQTATRRQRITIIHGGKKKQHATTIAVLKHNGRYFGMYVCTLAPEQSSL
jgi:hypothetical protein